MCMIVWAKLTWISSTLFTSIPTTTTRECKCKKKLSTASKTVEQQLFVQYHKWKTLAQYGFLLNIVTGTLKHVKKLCGAVWWYRAALVKRLWRRRLNPETRVWFPVATHLLTSLIMNLHVASLAPDSNLNRLISSASCLKSQQQCKCCTWLIIGSGHWREGRMSLRFSYISERLSTMSGIPAYCITVHLWGIRMEHQMADQLFIWASNFCSCWIYHVGVQYYLLWCPARLASWSCSFYRILSYLSFYQQPSIRLWAFPTEVYADDTTLHHEHSKTPFMFNISSSTGGDRLHRRVGWILAWQIWSCKDEDLVDQQRYHAWSTYSDNGRTRSYSNRQ